MPKPRLPSSLGPAFQLALVLSAAGARLAPKRRNKLQVKTGKVARTGILLLKLGQLRSLLFIMPPPTVHSAGRRGRRSSSSSSPAMPAAPIPAPAPADFHI